jgi:hypothetical protein
MMTEQSLMVTVITLLVLETLLLVLSILGIRYVGKQLDIMQVKKNEWISQLRTYRHDLERIKGGVSGVNFTTKTLLPATLASGPWKFILPLILRLI